MINLDARNVNDAYRMGMRTLADYGEVQDSRNGPVRRLFQPVATTYHAPVERVLFDAQRDANPFFHLIESLWMIAGRDDLASLTPYVKGMANYSDDGVILHGAYGHRWRNHFWDNKVDHIDQLDWVVGRLRRDPTDRRVVIQMWNPEVDVAMSHTGKDVPCNLTALPTVSQGCLNLTVFCRSNDAVWGAYGANAVHFSFLLEYLAARLGLQVGWYTQISNNFHAYLETTPALDEVLYDPYLTGAVTPYPIFAGWDLAGAEGMDEIRRERIIREDLRIFFDHGWREAATKARWPLLRQVAAPMAAAHEHWKKSRGEDRYLGSLEILEQVQASDWRLASVGWVQRRFIRWAAAQEDGVRYDDQG